MAGYYGNVDKKSIVNILDNGLAFLKDEVKEMNEVNRDKIWREFTQLEKLLYKEGETLLSMTNKVRFERRLNTVRKAIERKEG